MQVFIFKFLQTEASFPLIQDKIDETRLLTRVDSAMGEDDHEHNKRDDEDRHKDDGDAIEVLLDDTGSLIGAIDARSDHV